MQVNTEEVAKLLLGHVKDNAIKQVEDCLRDFNTSWRQVIRFELPLMSLMEYVLKTNTLVPKLLACEIRTMSAFHLAAMLGFNDILVNFLDKDVPVDTPLESGTTALHLASFAGHVSTIRLLLDIYKAEVDKQDGYGWGALHYASTEGHVDVVKILVGNGSDIHIRDKDGTSAAFRAQVNGHEDLISYFCKLGEEDDLLNVGDAGSNNNNNPEPLYSKVNKGAKKKTQPTDLTALVPPPAVPNKGDLANGEPTHQAALALARRQSEPRMQQRPFSEMVSSSVRPSDPRSATLPVRNKQDKKREIRRLIRQEIEAAFSDYQLPENAQGQDILEGALDAGVGLRTLKGVMREELVKYKQEQEQSSLNMPVPARVRDSMPGDPDYEDIYNTLKDLPTAPEPPQSPGQEPAPPPTLPPRNEKKADDRRKDTEDLFGTLTFSHENSAALEASMRKLAAILGTSWKQVAHALPIDINTAKVADRIKSIEQNYPGKLDKQAAMALAEWRINRGKRADVDCLILALRKCGLHDMISQVERVTQEFTA